jgi:hypothetical protein
LLNTIQRKRCIALTQQFQKIWILIDRFIYH